MKIGIYGQFYHEDADISIQILLEALYNKKNTVFIEENFFKINSKTHTNK